METIFTHISELALIGVGLLIRAIEKKVLKNKEKKRRSGYHD
jgi:hypothetical protein